MMSEDGRGMESKTCLVTGASRGIGFYTARGLAEKGAHVIIVGHDEGRGHEAAQQIGEEVQGGTSEFVLADLSTLAGMHHLADVVQQQHERLDVLVNNVGGFFLTRQETVDGFEMTFALDHLSYFVVTNLLLDLLRRSAPARIVDVASESHRGARIYFQDLQLERRYTGMRAYGQAKLGNLLFTYELARRLEGSGVTANALHPGFVDTNIGAQNPIVRPVLGVVHWISAKSPEEGAQTSIYLASSPEVRGLSGKYYANEEPIESSSASYDEEAAERLWRVSEELSELQPSVTA
jgi:NAD(P)-dependent dehydrogenase (short-subunit alcohol dehydrogenase family)